VPDPAIQAQIDSAIRNIYQAREIKDGLPAFQVGPTCYRGLWIVDGSFLLEAVTFLGRVDEARSGLKYLLGFQREDGAILLMNGHWKETGIALWAAARHARLTGDRAWLSSVWPKIEKGFAYILKMRQSASATPGAPNAGLIPEGFSDGGLGGVYPEYTNVYWTMVGMKAAVEAARWLGRDRQAEEWNREYLSFVERFRQAAERDTRVDRHGNRYVPIRMRDDQDSAPQKAQWAFLHAVFPGQVFATDDPLVLGNMAMLEAAEAEGLVGGTGWLPTGIWNYFASFYGHAWLWLGHGQKAARTLYAFANHASPLLAWREEQSLAGKGEEICGDMPHNWASAEFIRLVRDLLVLERPGEGAGELHLLSGLPREWTGPGAVTRLNGIITEFGPLSIELRVAGDGSSARLTLDPPERTPPSRIVLHLDGWSRESGTVDLPVTGKVERTVRVGS
jgi:GH15 family glucan-1,4-alpha-glucosidase